MQTTNTTVTASTVHFLMSYFITLLHQAFIYKNRTKCLSKCLITNVFLFCFKSLKMWSVKLEEVSVLIFTFNSGVCIWPKRSSYDFLVGEVTVRRMNSGEILRESILTGSLWLVGPAGTFEEILASKITAVELWSFFNVPALFLFSR